VLDLWVIERVKPGELPIAIDGTAARDVVNSVEQARTDQDLAAAEVAVMGTTAGRIGRNHPAESQERGMENSDQPQSRQTFTSGAGFMGGWLNVRGPLR